MSDIDQERAKEARLRRAAKRRGLRLVKSRNRTPETLVYGTYGLIDPYNNWVAYRGGDGYGLDLDEVEEELEQGREANHAS